MTSPGSEHTSRYRVCKECLQELPETSFNKVTKNGIKNLRTKCKSCMSLRQKKWYEANKEITIQRSAEWRKANIERNRELQRKYRVQGGEAYILRERNNRLRRHFNITLTDYNVLLDKQNGVCAACNKPETQIIKGSVASLAVDHDHACCPKRGYSCGKCIRGLLCSKCNMILGSVSDDVKLLANLSNYLIRGQDDITWI
jgi:hypothetical protein